MPEVQITAETRTEFGKGPARRTRRDGKVPGVLYGHGTDPRHVSLPGHDLMLALKTPNVLIRLRGLPGGAALALPKAVQRDPVKGFLEHVDLLLVRSGETVTVDIPIAVSGEVEPDGLLDQQMIRLSVEAEATHIPEQVEVDVEGMEIGSAVHAGDLKLPSGSKLAEDPEALVLHVIPAPTAEQIQAEIGEVPEEGEEAEGAVPAPADEGGEEAGEQAEESG